MSLVRAAALGILPRHQYMDHETWTWIAAKRPALTTPTGDLPPLGAPADRLAIPASWHLVSATLDSIHGTRHLMRTGVTAALLAAHLGLPPQARDATVV